MCPQRNSTKPRKSRKIPAGVDLQGHFNGEKFVLDSVYVKADSDVAQRAVQAFLRDHLSRELAKGA